MNEVSANHVIPATEDQVTVTNVTAGSATAAIVIANLPGARFVKISVDDGSTSADPAAPGAYLTRKHNAAPGDPDPTATTGTGRTQYYSHAELAALVFVPGDQIKLLIPSSGTYYVRQSIASPA